MKTETTLLIFVGLPEAKQRDFIQAALGAKINCTVSRQLNATISMNARLIA